MKISKCPDCSGELETGAILDFTHGSVLAERYAKTTLPEGKTKKMLMFSESDFDDIRRVVTYRCLKCNRLFSYAQEEISNKNINNKSSTTVFLVIIGITIFFILIGSILSLLGY